MLEMTMSSPEMSKTELIEILSKYQKKKKYYRLKNGDFIQIEEEGIAVLQEIRKDLNLTLSQMKDQAVRIPKYRALYLDEKRTEAQGRTLTFERDAKFLSMLQHMAVKKDYADAVPSTLVPVLRPYQTDGFVWLKMLCHSGFGGILADDMGLGKTLQILAFLLSEFQIAQEGENRRTLVVVPASLVFNWKNEMTRFAPELSVCTVTGKAEERRDIIQNAGERQILLTSYDLLRRDVEIYQEIPFFCEVIDEAQYIKNYNTKAARAVKKINAGFRVALTGTPVENRLSELWSIFDYLMPGFLYGYKRFREEFEIPVVQDGEKEVLERLQKLIGPFVLRRLKKEVLKDLPDKLEENVFAPLSGEQQRLYHAHVNRIKWMMEGKTDEEFQTARMEILSELTRLRQLCCNPGLVYENYKGNAEKIDMCMEIVEDAVQGGHKILLFSQFTSMLQVLQKRLEEREISYYTLTGSTGKEKRQELVERFNADDTSVFCISLKAGGTGLNLTAADVVIHYDPWWNLAVQNQATDRAHRIGQKNVVTVFKLVMKDTIEENIVHLQEKKKELADRLLGGEEVAKAHFSKEELLQLLE
jgi:SNF2 family DNA or RNA helicase